MSRGKKWFSESEKEELKLRLCNECEICWRIYGYKKTSISLLVKGVGISTGAFYALYSNKEELFYRTLVNLRKRLKLELKEILSKDKSKKGFKKAVKSLYKEYSQAPFLYSFDSADFVLFIEKLSDEERNYLKKDSMDFLSILLEESNLNLKVNIKAAYEAVALLLFTVSGRDKLSCDHEAAFDILLDGVVNNLFN